MPFPRAALAQRKVTFSCAVLAAALRTWLGKLWFSASENPSLPSGILKRDGRGKGGLQAERRKSKYDEVAQA